MGLGGRALTHPTLQELKVRQQDQVPEGQRDGRADAALPLVALSSLWGKPNPTGVGWGSARTPQPRVARGLGGRGGDLHQACPRGLQGNASPSSAGPREDRRLRFSTAPRAIPLQSGPLCSSRGWSWGGREEWGHDPKPCWQEWSPRRRGLNLILLPLLAPGPEPTPRSPRRQC